MQQAGDGSRTSVAIIGSGMAGLVSAYLLTQDNDQRFDVEVFETQDQLSLDSASVTVTSQDGKRKDRVDLPMRAFAGGFYNNLRTMYDYLGVEYTSQPFLFSFSRPPLWNRDGRPGWNSAPYFIHSSNNHRMPPVRPAACGFWGWMAEVMYLIICYAWFTTCCFLVPPRTAAMSRLEEDVLCESLDRYLRRIRLPVYFVQNYLLPLISSVTTCSHQALLKFPARDIVEYKKRTHKAPHYVVVAGVHEVQEKLARGLKVTLSSRVTSVQHCGSKIRVSWKERAGKPHGSAIQQQKLFDHVVMGVSPDVVGAIFEPLRKDMAHIPTIYVESIVHTDISTLLSQGIWNEKPTSHSGGSNESQTIHLRSSAGSTESVHEQPSSVVVTTCPTTPIDPAKIIRRSGFTRVLRTPRSREIVNRVFGNSGPGAGTLSKSTKWRNGDGNIWLVGGWCWDGMVLLEGCVVSAMRMADGMGVQIPWRNS